jgi:hypothetical protein
MKRNGVAMREFADPYALLQVKFKKHADLAASATRIRGEGWSWRMGGRSHHQPIESMESLYLGLFGDLQRIVDLESKTEEGALRFCVVDARILTSG